MNSNRKVFEFIDSKQHEAAYNPLYARTESTALKGIARNPSVRLAEIRNRSPSERRGESARPSPKKRQAAQ